MAKLLEATEYDVITGNPDYKEGEDYRYLEPEAFRELIGFIHSFEGGEDAADALDFMSISYKRNVGEVVKLKNYVGLIQLKSGCQIQVLPKISFGNGGDRDHKETKRVFLKMLKSMKDFPGKAFHEAGLMVDRMNLYEIFINMYLQEVRKLVKLGIRSDYVQQEDNLGYCKGKLLAIRHIRTNIAHAERFYVAYDEFHPNRAENRLIKATLLKLQQLTGSGENAKEIRQLLTAFEQVAPSANIDKDFSQIRLDRNTKHYEMLMQWSRVFLKNRSFTTFSGSQSARALLFPMEKVFESFVAQKLKNVLSPAGWEVSSQEHGYYLFTEPRNQFALRPDIVCRQGARTVIMDTKWKNLVDKERLNYGISQADMYQMYAYSKKYNTPEIWLLYPMNEEMRRHKQIHFSSEDQVTVRLHFVDVAQIEENLEELKEKMEAAQVCW